MESYMFTYLSPKVRVYASSTKVAEILFSRYVMLSSGRGSAPRPTRRVQVLNKRFFFRLLFVQVLESSFIFLYNFSLEFESVVWIRHCTLKILGQAEDL